MIFSGPSDRSYLHSALSFLLASGAADQAQAWQQADNSTRTSLKQKYSETGIKIIVSAFDSTETPTASKENPTTVASQVASWVKQYGMDGIDVDWEVSRLFSLHGRADNARELMMG